MKAYKDKNGMIRLFRPQKNMARLNLSMGRLAMPNFNSDGFLECIKQLLRIDESWIPEGDGYSIYLRPTAIGTSPFLGVEASNHIKLYVILSPVGPYYKSGFQPIKLFADTVNVRAWPGGSGCAKVGGNYGPSILPSKVAAQKHGAAQVTLSIVLYCCILLMVVLFILHCVLFRFYGYLAQTIKLPK